jgi:hypothetical protein
MREERMQSKMEQQNRDESVTVGGAQGATMKLELVTADMLRKELYGKWPEMADRINTALSPILAEREAAILRGAAEIGAMIAQDEQGHDPDCPWFYNDVGNVAGCTCEANEVAEKIRKHILALSPADALARHDAAELLKMMADWNLLARVQPSTDGDWNVRIVADRQSLEGILAGRTP